MVAKWVITNELSTPFTPTVWKREGLGLLTNHWYLVAKRQGHPWLEVRLDVVVEDKRLTCKSVVLSSPKASELTSEDLRMVPINRLMRQSATNLVMDVGATDSGARTLEPTARSEEELVKDLPDTLGPRRSPGRPRGESLLRMVELYRREIDNHNPTPRKAIAEEMNYSVEYVGKRLSIARQRGLLGSARPGRAGEVSSAKSQSAGRRRSVKSSDLTR
jgi:hypothetical protein